MVDVVYNDVIPQEIVGCYDAVVLSPGPGLPSEAGEMPDLIAKISGSVPIFGVCLGMQALAVNFGGELENQKVVKHGVQEEVQITGDGIFQDISSPVKVGLYHSWIVSENGDYEVTARSNSGVVMAIKNDKMMFVGVQFHPESVMTEHGMQMLENFLNYNWGRTRAD